MFKRKQIEEIQIHLENKILSFRNNNGYWSGYLSSSALSTAVATFALWFFDKEKNKKQIHQGLNWLSKNINPDGGYGDTTKSKSNLSTTLLCWSAFSIVKYDIEYIEVIKKIENWLLKEIKSLKPAKLSKAVLNHYKTDRTFSVPILAMCALAGRLGDNGWKYIPQLPYQFAIFPDKFFRIFNLSVVSYAIPALISMGLVRAKMKPPINPLMRFVNKLVHSKVIKVLEQKQPKNGGFLEATPLTGFVLMTLIGADLKHQKVCSKAESFLLNSIRKDGSWPIDTSLTTWVTTLAVNSLSENSFSEVVVEGKVKDWLLSQQHKNIHPFTKSKPGGWAWIDLEGGVPDGDDTSGALISLRKMYKHEPEIKNAAFEGIKWLVSIQNKDGGFPTFCKGWGKLPFDASCADITAHAIRAFMSWVMEMDIDFQIKIQQSTTKAIQFLKNVQRNDGSWLPLWFGNEEDKNHQNPVYGTAHVIYGLKRVLHLDSNIAEIIDNGLKFLIDVKNNDGGWGGNKNIKSSIEETSLALRALANDKNEYTESIEKGLQWLLSELENEKIEAAPIGLYFASLWYYEEMYPYVYANAALSEILK
jgi:prenyltransferase beta subunit